MITPTIPSWLPAVSLILGALLGGGIGYLFGLMKLDRERELNKRRREAMRRHAISRGDRLGATHNTKKEQ